MKALREQLDWQQPTTDLVKVWFQKSDDFTGENSAPASS
jgi:hypothetical protein